MILNMQFEFFTDTATLAVFDPHVVKQHANDEDWWIDFDDKAEKSLPEITTGLMSLIALGEDGKYSLHVTNETLSKDEKDFSVDVIGPLAIKSHSGQVFFGQAECLPGYGEFNIDLINDNQGKLIALAPGEYTLQIYAINKPAEIKLKDKLADIVIVLTATSKNLPLIKSNYRLDWNKRGFLFPSPRTNKLKIPKMGLEIELRVDTDRNANKILRQDFVHGGLQKWPLAYDDYSIVLADMSQLKVGNSVKVKTISFDEEKKIIYAEMLKRRFLP